jgi:hypothetical protein
MKHISKKFLFRLFMIILVGVITFTNSTLSVFADGYNAQFFGSSSPPIIWYNPDDTGCGSDTLTYNGVTSVANVTDTPALKAIFTQLLTSSPNTLNAVQVAAIMGNMYSESGLNPTAQEPDGSGYGLAQWSSPGRKQGLANYASSQGKPESDPTVQVGYLLQEYNNQFAPLFKGTDFATGTDIAAATTSWMDIFESPLVQTGTDPSALNSKRIPAAVKIYSFYSSLAPGGTSSSVTAQNCSGADGIVAGNIVKTALALSLPAPETPDRNYQLSSALNDKDGYSDARDTYQDTKPKINPTADWSDCGGFIATVMISSGADPDYVKVGVSKQITYVEANPSKFKIIKNPTIADLQPGDILLSNVAGHTQMYTGNGSLPVAQASLGGEVPNQRAESSVEWMLGHDSASSPLILARYIGNAS